GDEVQVRELGDRVADALVDAAGDVASLDVRDRPIEIRGSHRDRELLEAIAADHDDVRIGGVNPVGELERREARRLGHRDVVAALDQVEQGRRDGEAGGLDVGSDAAAVLVEQDRAAEHQLEIDLRMLVQLPDEELTAAVVGAARHREADPPPAALRLLAGGRREHGFHRSAKAFALRLTASPYALTAWIVSKT